MKPYRRSRAWRPCRTFKPEPTSLVPAEALDWTVRMEFSPNAEHELCEFAHGNRHDAMDVGKGVVAGWLAWRFEKPCRVGSLYCVGGLPIPFYVRVAQVCSEDRVLTIQVLAP